MAGVIHNNPLGFWTTLEWKTPSCRFRTVDAGKFCDGDETHGAVTSRSSSRLDNEEQRSEQVVIPGRSYPQPPDRWVIEPNLLEVRK